MDFKYHFIVMSTATNEIVSDLLKLPNKIRNNSVIITKVHIIKNSVNYIYIFIKITFRNFIMDYF